MNEMKISHPLLGDKLVTWNPDDAEEVKLAKTEFDEALSKGMFAYRVAPTGKDQIMEFDPKAGRILISTALAGG